MDLSAVSLSPLSLVLAFGAGYLLGAIPTGLLLTKLAGIGDIRRMGSGNIGMTNVLRTGRKDLAALTLLGDAGKGALAVFIGLLLGPGAVILAALGAFLGHLYPVWLRFKGGKGVATYLGLVLAVNPWVGAGFALIWIATAYLTRFSSLSALIASGTTPFLFWALGQNAAAGLFGCLTAILWIKHHENIARLRQGQESRIGQKAPLETTEPGPTA